MNSSNFQNIYNIVQSSCTNYKIMYNKCSKYKVYHSTWNEPVSVGSGRAKVQMVGAILPPAKEIGNFKVLI